jgi:DNA-binding NarL/FixJ family response regulator
MLDQVALNSRPQAKSAMKPRFNVLIADDHAIVRAGYRQFLQEHPQVGDIGEATSGSDTLAKLRVGNWNILLLDISMPDRGGLDILQRIRATNPEIRILVVSGLPEYQYASGVLKMGAVGYLSKDMAGPDLLRALTTVMQGNRFVSEALAEMLAQELMGERPTAAHEQLSTRELQIFLKLAEGKTIGQIGAELSLSVKTVSTYRSRILTTLSATTNAQLTGYAIRQGLIQ